MRRISAVVVATLLVVSLFGATALIGVADTGDPNDAKGSGVTVDEGLQEANGTAEILVRVDTAPTYLTDTNDPEKAQERLQEHAERTQKPILEYADKRPYIEVLNTFWIANAVLLEVDTNEVDVSELGEVTRVERVEENEKVELIEPMAVSNDSVSPASSNGDYTYGLEQINAPDVWEDFDTKGEGVKVAVLDTGVDVDHPDIELYTEDPEDPTYPGGWAEFDGSGNEVVGSEPEDTGSHGTHVSGTVAGGNSSGTWIGVAPEVDLMNGLVLPGGSGTRSQVIAGMEWAVEEDADIVSMSLGSIDYGEEYIEPIRNAEASGTIVVSSSGNSGEDTSGSPANVYDAFAIGASDETEEVAWFSSGEEIETLDAWGDDAPEDWPDEYIVPDVAGPGVEVLSSVPDEEYDYASGTSMAAPHVSGAIALYLSVEDSFGGPGSTKEAFVESAWKPEGESEDQDTRYGHGIIDVHSSLVTNVADAEVQGTIVNENGDPIEQAEVTISSGENVLSASDGTFLGGVVSGEREVTASAWGYETESKIVDVEEGDTVQVDFELNRIFNVSPIIQDEQMAQGATSDVVYDAEFIENVTVNIEDNSTVDPGDVTLYIDGEEWEFGETKDFDDLVYHQDFTISVKASEEASGTLVLRSIFERADDSIIIETEEIEIRQPIAITGTEGKEGSNVTRGPFDSNDGDSQSLVFDTDQVNPSVQLTGVDLEDNWVPMTQLHAENTSDWHRAGDFSNDEEYFVLGFTDYDQSPTTGQINVYDTQTWSVQTTITTENNIIREVSFSHDDQYLAIISDGVDAGEMLIIDTEDWSIEHQAEYDNRLYDVQFSKDGDYVAHIDSSWSVRVYDTGDWALEQELGGIYDDDGDSGETYPGTTNTRNVDFSPTDPYLAFTNRSNELFVYDTTDWTEVTVLDADLGEDINETTKEVVFSPDGQYLAYALTDIDVILGGTEEVRVYETDTWTNEWEQYYNGMNHIGFSLDSEYMSIINTQTPPYELEIRTVGDWEIDDKITIPEGDDRGAVTWSSEYIAYLTDRDEGIYEITEIDGIRETTDPRIYVNGEFAGMHLGKLEDGETTTVDLFTDELERGEHEIEITLDFESKVEWEYQGHNDARTHVRGIQVNDDFYEVGEKLSQNDEYILPIKTDLDDVNDLSIVTYNTTETHTANITFLPEEPYSSVTVYRDGEAYPNYTHGSPLTINEVEPGVTYEFQLSGGLFLPGDDGLLQRFIDVVSETPVEFAVVGSLAVGAIIGRQRDWF